MRPANTPGLNQHPDYLNGFYPFEQQKDAINVWNKHIDEARKHVYPTVNYTPEEATEIANITAMGKDNLNAGISNIILGKASIDTYEDVIKEAKREAELAKMEAEANEVHEVEVIGEDKEENEE